MRLEQTDVGPNLHTPTQHELIKAEAAVFVAVSNMIVTPSGGMELFQQRL